MMRMIIMLRKNMLRDNIVVIKIEKKKKNIKTKIMK